MSIFTQMITAAIFVVSAAQAQTTCHYYDGAPAYELSIVEGTFSLTAVRDAIPLERVMELLKVDQLVEESFLGDEDVVALLGAIEETELADRAFRKGDVLTVAPGTTISLATVATDDFGDAKNVEITIDAKVYNKVAEVIKASEITEAKEGNCP